ncbi:MAG TPA: hypothetical protein VGG74_21100 [Kofleriaceae bacterium]
MRLFLTGIGIVVALAGMGVGAFFLIQRHDAALQDERDRSDPAFCARENVSGIGDVCWVDGGAECEHRGLACDEVDAYACVRGRAITADKRTRWCFRMYGECVDFRRGLVRDAEYDQLGECELFHDWRWAIKNAKNAK